MKTIVVGYKETSGLASGSVIASPDSSGKNFDLMAKAKQRHIFPEGYKRLELYKVGDAYDMPEQVAIFVSDDASSFSQAAHAKADKADSDSRAIGQAERDREQNIKLASRLLQAAAEDRNKALGAVAAQKNLLTTTGDKEKTSIQKKIDDLQTKAEASIWAFNKVLAAFNVVKNPKSTPDEINAALVELGIKKPSAE